MKRRLLALLSALSVLCMLMAGTGVSVVAADTDTSWFADAKYGIATTISYSGHNTESSKLSGGASTSWNACVNEFDVDNFVDQVVQTGASYVQFGMQQADRYFCAPNATYTGLIEASGVDALDACSDRDLPMELADALAAKGIKLMLYITGDGTWKEEEIFEGVLGGEINDGSRRPVINAGGDDEATVNFKRNWLAIIEEYAERYGDKVAGWWVDGCDLSKWSSAELVDFAAMLKEHNPDAIVSFNQGGPYRAPGYSLYDEGDPDDNGKKYVGTADDFTAGEHHTFDSYPQSQFVTDKNGAAKQWHILSYLYGDPYTGNTSGMTCLSAEYMIDYLKAVGEKKGVATISVSVGRTGNILSNELAVMKEIAAEIKGITQPDPDRKYEIIQDYEGENTDGALWGHASYVNGDSNQTPVTKDPDAKQATLSGFGSFFSQITSYNSGSDYLVANAADMQCTIENPTGIFFRLKTNRNADTTMYLSTIGAASGVHAWGGNNEAAYSLMNAVYNEACTSARYYGLDGSYMTVEEDGRVIPANFDGYVFIPFDVSSKTFEGLTVMYAQNWALTGSYPGTIDHWYANDNPVTVVGFDNIGFYSAESADECRAIIREVEGSYVSYDYDIIQDYEGENTDDMLWGHGDHVNGDSYMDPVTVDPSTVQPPLSGSGSFFSQITNAESGSDYLITSADMMQHSVKNPTGIFFRLKTNRAVDTTMYLSTFGADGNEHAWGGNNEAAYSLMNYQYNEAVLNARYYTLDGTDVTVIDAGNADRKDGRVIPANFDGYVFLPFDVNAKSLEGLVVMYAQSWALTGSYKGTIGGWHSSNPVTVVGFDNIGFYSAAKADDCKAIIQAVEGSYESPKGAYEHFQGYETAGEQANAAAAGMAVTSGDGAGMTNRYTSADQLGGTTSRELYFIANNYGGDYLVMNAPASTLKNTTGVYVRMKTNTAKDTFFHLLATSDKDGKLTWPDTSKTVKYYSLEGELVADTHCTLPAGFDGYAFIPCGDVEGQAIAAQLLPTWYGQAYGDATNATHWWVAGAEGSYPTVLFDNIGYYTVSSDDHYAEIIADLNEKYAPVEPKADLEQFQSYESTEQRANAAKAGEHVGVPDGWKITNRFVTDNTLSGSYSRELYWDADAGTGSDYLVMEAPASTLANTTGIYIRLRTNTVKDTTLTLLPTTDIDGTITDWPNTATAMKYYTLDGELVLTSNCICPAGFDGYVFIPTGDVAGQAIAAMLLPAWYGNAYGTSQSLAEWWFAGPESGVMPTVLFDNIGYYYAPNGTAADYVEIMAAAEAGLGNPSVEFEVFQDYESDEKKANSADIDEHIGVPDSAMLTNRYATANAISGTYTRELYWYGEAGTGADYLVMEAPASTLANTTGIYIRMFTNTVKTTSFTILPTADADGQVSDWPTEATALQYYNLEGELVLTSSCLCPAGFDGYVFIPTGDVEGQAIAAMLLADWFGDGYGNGGSEAEWWNAGANGKPTILFDNVGYYYAPNGTAADFKAIIDGVEASYTDFRDIRRKAFQVATEARGLDITTGVGADLAAQFEAAIAETTYVTEADAIYDTYRSQSALLGNPVRLNVGAAQIRESDSALRFILEVDQAFLDYMNETYTNVEFGTLLARADLFTGEMVCSTLPNYFSDKEATTIPRTSTFTLTADEYNTRNDGDTLVYTCVLRGIPENSYDTVLRARNYLKYTDGDTEYVIYGDEVNTTYQQVADLSA